MKTKARIVERTSPAGDTTWVIQQPHWLCRWVWVDAWCNSWAGAACQDSFHSQEEADRNLCWFDGTATTDKVL